MAVRLRGTRKPYEPKDTDEVRCDIHGFVTTWGAMGPLQRLALESGLDVAEGDACLLMPDCAPLERKWPCL